MPTKGDLVRIRPPYNRVVKIAGVSGVSTLGHIHLAVLYPDVYLSEWLEVI